MNSIFNKIKYGILTVCFFIKLIPLHAQNDSIDLAFKPNEVIKFIMHYGPFIGGIATSKIQEIKHNGKEMFHAKITAKTVGLADWVYNVFDVYESIFDKNSCLPLVAIRDVAEGSTYTEYNKVSFDQDSLFLKSTKSGLHEMPHKLFDIVSVFYYMRSVTFDSLELKKVFKYSTWFCDEQFDLILRYAGPDTVSTGIGKFSCYKFHPVVEAGRVFKTKDDVTFWISDDKNYLPIRLKLDIIVGSFKADLSEYSNLKYPLSSKIEE